MEELKPCPFCGSGQDNIAETPFPTNRMFTEYAARCGNPACAAEVLGDDPEEVILRWNNRVRTACFDCGEPLGSEPVCSNCANLRCESVAGASNMSSEQGETT